MMFWSNEDGSSRSMSSRCLLILAARGPGVSPFKTGNPLYDRHHLEEWLASNGPPPTVNVVRGRPLSQATRPILPADECRFCRKRPSAGT